MQTFNIIQVSLFKYNMFIRPKIKHSDFWQNQHTIRHVAIAADNLDFRMISYPPPPSPQMLAPAKNWRNCGCDRKGIRHKILLQDSHSNGGTVQLMHRKSVLTFLQVVRNGR